MNLEEVKQISTDFAKLILEELKPKYIILYGSYAKGTAKNDSDIDIAVIFDKYIDKFFDYWIWMFTLTKIHKFRQIEPDILNLQKDSSGFASYILQTGIIIYPFSCNLTTSI
ncbi:MAG: nucleotidyltransferase domain-containing protein [Deltaproteobacteria bacterium]|nr:nucleotidyltransferase domain-containing protein [Deltaproteobacteria bacterium]